MRVLQGSDQPRGGCHLHYCESMRAYALPGLRSEEIRGERKYVLPSVPERVARRAGIRGN